MKEVKFLCIACGKPAADKIHDGCMKRQERRAQKGRGPNISDDIRAVEKEKNK